MALSTMAEMTENKLLLKLIEQNQQIIELNQKMTEQSRNQNEKLDKLVEKATIAEMRQCALAGEGTDAARMTRLYCTSESALWSKQIKNTIIEMIYTDRSLKSMSYSGIFHGKDKRRSELLCAVFYKTAIKKELEVYDAFEDCGRRDGTPHLASIRGGF